MDIRTALQQQSPSLALQRAAADEIARLDGELQLLATACRELRDALTVLSATLESTRAAKQ